MLPQECISQATFHQMLPGLSIVNFDRLFADVSAGHHQRKDAVRGAGGHEQVLERRIGEHDAQFRQVKRHRGGKGGCGRTCGRVPPFEQHNWSHGAGKQLLFCGIDVAELPCLVKCVNHHGEAACCSGACGA